MRCDEGRLSPQHQDGTIVQITSKTKLYKKIDASVFLCSQGNLQHGVPAFLAPEHQDGTIVQARTRNRS
jgi:hypothetical protein